jgi:hypothetical protein
MTFEPIAVTAFLSLGLLAFEPVRVIIVGLLSGLAGLLLGLFYLALGLAVISLLIAAMVAIGPVWVIAILLALLLLK